MDPDPDRTQASTATFRFHLGYRYTVVTIANGAQPGTAEAELWWDRPGEQDPRWRYFRRHVAATGAEAARRVEADFREWVEGQMEAEGR
jgi:hypothetical protein